MNAQGESSRRFVLWRSPLAIAPVVFIAVFIVRSLFPVFDPLVLSITIALVVIVGFMSAGQRWAGLAFQAFPIAVFTSPAGREFAFNLSSTDDPRWRWHAVVGLLSLGVSAIAAWFVVWGRRPPVATVSGAVGGVAFGLVMIAGLGRIYPQPTVTGSLNGAQRQALPVIDLLSFGFDAPELRLVEGAGFRARVRNPSSLPHTLTIDDLGIEIYVPARREAILQIEANRLPRRPLPIYCSIGDHRSLGMARTLEFTLDAVVKAAE